MNLSIIAAVLMALLFQFYYLIAKRLQENGMSSMTVLYYQRLAVIPGGLLLLATYRKAYIEYLIAHPLILAAIVFSSLVWMLHTYIRVYVLESVNSMSFLNAFSAIISIPLLLIAGIIFNHDLPNTPIIIALCLLLLALLIRPTAHADNARKKVFVIGVFAAVTLSLFGQSVDAINMGAYRYFFEHINFTFFGIGIFIFLSALVINIFFLFAGDKQRPDRGHNYGPLPYALPVLFAVATFFEGNAVTSISIYALAAIGAFTFLIDSGSDLYHKRIRLTPRTAVFMLLVIASSVFSAVSTRKH